MNDSRFIRVPSQEHNNFTFEQVIDTAKKMVEDMSCPYDEYWICEIKMVVRRPEVAAIIEEFNDE